MPTPTPAPSTTIAEDDWESAGAGGGSGWLAAWDFQGGNNAVVTTAGAAYSGSYHLRLRSSNGFASRTVDLSGKSGVHLTFYAKVDSFEGSDNARVLVSVDGVFWTEVKAWTSADSDNIYKLVDIDLSSFAMTSAFHIAFEGNMSNSADRLYVDNIELN